MKTENIFYRSSNAYRMVRHLTIVISLIILFSACATPPQKVQWKQDAAQPLTCSKGPDCEAKWTRALLWVENNAKSKIQIANETIITTDFPTYSNNAVISITKTEKDAGIYAINFRASCSAIMGCEPTILELKASFANYVMKSIDAPLAAGQAATKGQKEKDVVTLKADLGIVTVKTSRAAADKLGMKEPKGTRIIYIGSDSAAFDFGLHPDDVILKFAEKTIDDAQDLDAALEQTVPPKIVPITIWRAGAGEMVISVRFQKVP